MAGESTWALSCRWRRGTSLDKRRRAGASAVISDVRNKHANDKVFMLTVKGVAGRDALDDRNVIDTFGNLKCTSSDGRIGGNVSWGFHKDLRWPRPHVLRTPSSSL